MALMISYCLTACSESEEAPTTNFAELIVGEWELVESHDLDYDDVSYPDVTKNERMSYTFDASGVGHAYQSGEKKQMLYLDPYPHDEYVDEDGNVWIMDSQSPNGNFVFYRWVPFEESWDFSYTIKGRTIEMTAPNGIGNIHVNIEKLTENELSLRFDGGYLKHYCKTN